MSTAARHETRALLRAHLSAATGYRHLTRHCPVCARLLRLAMEPRGRAAGTQAADSGARQPARPSTGPSTASEAAPGTDPVSPEAPSVTAGAPAPAPAKADEDQSPPAR
ncbi:hypothetical protein A6A06_24570 [Streptomyces sp. CB02923]|uniref:DUF6274 family protein n=1 Tax=Streptomyces sp. CB02923 TaxID=1718985 RepID=UPI00093B64EC|nr:DUF6274 family protein [Streptomyces sp. CB02923]OKI00308.1 hypothetical protein A6A06_24570 [Streptomyces sp. CB02923]